MKGKGNEELCSRIVDRWSSRADLDLIRAGLRRRGCDFDRLRPEDLAASDQLHSGQLEATRAFAEWVGLEGGERVLDVGAGLGGSARFLALEHDCRVTALDLTPALCEIGRELTRWMDLEPKVEHLCLDVASGDLDSDYHLIWFQHVDMHIPDKVGVYERCRRALHPGRGRLVWHDWLAGNGGELRLPVPWSSETDDVTFLSSAEALRHDLETAGLRLGRFRRMTSETVGWFTESRKGLRHLLKRHKVQGRGRLERLNVEVENTLLNIEEGRLVPFFGEAEPVTR